jgi:hypothetical protein
MSSLADVFASLSEDEQERIAQSYLANEMLLVATTASSGVVTKDGEMDLLVRMVELTNHKLVSVLSEQHRQDLDEIAQQVRDLIKIQVADDA